TTICEILSVIDTNKISSYRKMEIFLFEYGELIDFPIFWWSDTLEYETTMFAEIHKCIKARIKFHHAITSWAICFTI
ncbi:MAG: hypothetical protein WA461_01045, partial [Nitrososphaeraceae archaeon]